MGIRPLKKFQWTRDKMSEDLRDSFRRAAGLPTSADKQEAAAKRAKEKALWDKNEPLRKAAMKRYGSFVKPIIDETVAISNEVLKDAHHAVVENGILIGVPTVLAQRTFNLRALPPSPQRGAPHALTQISSKGTLHLTLDGEGNLSIEVVGRNTKTFPIDIVGPNEIENAFRDLLSSLKR
jgi:hypothetical protein